MSEKIIRIKSGNEEFTMNVTEEEYRNYYRPWWQMKKKEQRNREAMEQNGYTEESYDFLCFPGNVDEPSADLGQCLRAGHP